MKVEVLASVMNQSMEQIAEQMNLQSDAVIINQCDRLSSEEMEHRGHRVRFFSFPDRGIGKSRNEAIVRADRDICLFSDEDIVYEDGYEEAIVREFEVNPKADMILFNIEIDEARRTYHITDRNKVHWYNCGRYGAVSFAIRRESLLASGVKFSLLFGGGAKYSNGEDSLFIREALKKGLKVYKAPVTLGAETERESTWFSGYHEKFFFDRGVLYHYLYGKLAGVIALRFLLKHRTVMCQEIPWKKAYAVMKNGIREAKSMAE